MLSQTAEYALRAVVTLAREVPRAATAQEIARQSQVPPDYLSKVMKMLARAGLVTAQRGRRGGFSLVVSPARMSVLDVVNAVEPLRRIRACPLRLRSHATTLCPLHRKLDDALSMVEEAFRSASIASLCKESRGTRALCPEGVGETYVAISSR